MNSVGEKEMERSAARSRGLVRGTFWATLTLLLGCENLAPPNQSWTAARVEGRVVDERTGAPLTGVNVWRVRGKEIGDAYPSDKGAKQMQYRPVIATTDTSGQFVLEGERTASLFWQSFPDFSVTLRFQKDGYQTLDRRFTNVVSSKESPEPLIRAGEVPLIAK